MTKYDDVCADLVNSPRRWLVTGVAGFIGSALLERLLDLGQSVVGVDNFITGHQRNIDDVLSINPDEKLQFKFIEGDLRDPEVAAKAVKNVDIVLHQAALGSVPRSLKDPIASHEHNVNGFLNVLNAAREAAPKTAPIATSANAPGERCATGQILSTTIANTEPMAALTMNIGASRPPEVPEPSEITESAPTAGLQQTSTLAVGKDWSGARLVAPRTASKKR